MCWDGTVLLPQPFRSMTAANSMRAEAGQRARNLMVSYLSQRLARAGTWHGNCSKEGAMLYPRRNFLTGSAASIVAANQYGAVGDGKKLDTKAL